MNKVIDIKPEIKIPDSEYERLLGYPPGYVLEGKSKELADWAKNWYAENGEPWIYAFKTGEIKISEAGLEINNVRFSSKKVRDKFLEAQAEGAFIAAVSAGKECERKAMRLWKEGKPDEYFFLEIYGSAVVEYLTAITGFRFCDWADKNNLAVIPGYSPGYPGWNIEDQNPLLELIKKNAGNKLPGELSAFETGMLFPKKSQLSIFGITRYTDKVGSLRDLVPCTNCSLAGCDYRRMPYKKAPASIEDVNNFNKANQANFSGINFESAEVDLPGKVLDRNAKYSVGVKTLKKWAEQKLQINFSDDSSVEAKFLFEGTTCSNLGRPLEFEYSIKLNPASEGYKIKDLNCRPAEGDEGYLFMCDYISDGGPLLKIIEDEKPLAGRPLNDVVNWERPFNPEGCLCKRESREHKWGLILEVLHYALANNVYKNSTDTNVKITSELNSDKNLRHRPGGERKASAEF